MATPLPASSELEEGCERDAHCDCNSDHIQVRHRLLRSVKNSPDEWPSTNLIQFPKPVPFFLVQVKMMQSHHLRSAAFLISLVCAITDQDIQRVHQSSRFLRDIDTWNGPQATPIDQIKQIVTFSNPPKLLKGRKWNPNRNNANDIMLKKELFAAGSPVTSESYPNLSTMSPSLKDESSPRTPIKSRPSLNRRESSKKRKLLDNSDDAWLLSKVNSYKTRRQETCFARLKKLIYCDVENSILRKKIPKECLSFRKCTSAEVSCHSESSIFVNMYRNSGLHVELVRTDESNEICALVISSCRYRPSN